MINRIRIWIERRNDRRRLEAMSDRLLDDMGVERDGIAVWLRGDTAAEPATTTRPWGVRLRSATVAFVRELRTDAPQQALTH